MVSRRSRANIRKVRIRKDSRCRERGRVFLHRQQAEGMEVMRHHHRRLVCRQVFPDNQAQEGARCRLMLMRSCAALPIICLPKCFRIKMKMIIRWEDDSFQQYLLAGQLVLSGY